jgi:prepilin-type N-terminal cleavage/methylation domain-containing protein
MMIAPERKGAGSSRGLTLIEILVVMSVVLILVALLSPALRAARDKARTIRPLSSTAAAVRSLSFYSLDHREQHLYMQFVEQPWRPVELDGRPRASLTYFRAGSEFWVNFMPDSYLEFASFERDPVTSTGRNNDHDLPGSFIWSSYRLTSTYFASREFWEPAPRQFEDHRYCKGTRSADVEFPSRKGIMLYIGSEGHNAQGSGLSASEVVGFADASAEIWSARRRMDAPVAAATPGNGLVLTGVLATPSGLAGVDRP